ncbi:MAG: ATP-dependent DNA helicase [Gemmatimonadota bacterium]
MSSRPHLLDPAGPIGRALSGFEPRASQARMMELVEGAFRDDGLLCVEAGTGTGKTLAYLIPAIRWAAETGEKVVISTNTIALQEQILQKDLPLVSAALGLPIEAVLVKGRNNYVCRRKVAELASTQKTLIEPTGRGFAAGELERVARWIEEQGETDRPGDPIPSRAEMGFVPPLDLWEEIKSDRDSCLRTKCPHHQTCFYYRMRRAAARANVLIANHHLVFADLALKSGLTESAGEGEAVAGVLPAYTRLILDEAHHIEEVASEYFGAEVSRTGVLRALARLTGSDRRATAGGVLPMLGRLLLARAPSVEPGTRGAWMDAADRIDSRLAPFGRWLADTAVSAFAAVHAWALAQPVESEDGSRRVRLRDEADERWRLEVIPALNRLTNPTDGLLALADELKSLRKDLVSDDEEANKGIEGPLVDLMGLVSSMERAAAAIDMVAMGEGPGVAPVHAAYVRWIEAGTAGATRMIATPIELGPLLARHLFNANKTVVLTSATLTTAGAFDYLATRLGLGEIVEGRAASESLASPFDWERQALVAIPTDIPAPDEDGFDEALPERVLEAIEVTEGGVFVLFTSYRLLNRTHDALVGRLVAMGLTVLRHGDGERHELLRRFKADANAVLFATESFWEGVDVPGEALRNVILTRLPFRVPSDPVLVARSERITARGGDAFAELSIPQALLKFRQGLGRLIRTRTDRGILVILDKRVLTRRYGRRFLASLPPCRVEKGYAADVFASARAFLAP